jgi:hypothetical protein
VASLLWVRKQNLSLTAQSSRARSKASTSRNSCPSVGRQSSAREDIEYEGRATTRLEWAGRPSHGDGDGDRGGDGGDWLFVEAGGDIDNVFHKRVAHTSELRTSKYTKIAKI